MSTAPDQPVSRRLVAPELLPFLDAMPRMELSVEILPVIRAGAAAMPPPPLTPELEAVRREERHVPGAPGDPDVRVLVYTPPGAAAGLRPAYLQIHGGGFVLGTAEMSDLANRMFCAGLDCIVVAVDYRLAPDTPFPGAVNDCHAALRWLAANASALGVDPTRIAIGGESAGGGHAAALALRVRDEGKIPLCLQLLDAPMLDDRTGTGADSHPFAGEFVWRPESNRFGWRCLLGREPGGPAVPAGAVPARAEDLGGLPPTFIIVGALDLFAEENMEYARRLMRAGVPTELHLVPGAYHGYASGGAGAAPMLKAHWEMKQGALARVFSR
jgi:triacylglycerol lipase